MPRSTNAPASRARRKKIFRKTSGFFGKRKNVYTIAKNAVEKSMLYAYRDRRVRKRAFRRLWIQRINAAARQFGTTYSRLIRTLQQKHIHLNRKVLADFAMNKPDAFKAIVTKAGLVAA